MVHAVIPHLTIENYSDAQDTARHGPLRIIPSNSSERAVEPEDVEAVCRGWSRGMRALYPGQTQLDAVPEHGGDDEFRI